MAQKLKLHSPVGSDPLILKWPIPTSEGKDGPEEVLDTIKLACEDYPELKVPLETRILKDGEDVSSYDYEQTRAMCDRYNKAIDSLRQQVRGHTRQKLVNKQASMKQLKHILQQCYNHSVKDPEKLNHYEPFSPEVYGETSFELVEQMIKSVKFSEHDYFIDLGSGVGQVVLQVSAATNCKFCYGVEKAEWPAEYAVGMEKEFRKWMKWYGKDHGEFKIDKGDFLHDGIKDKLGKATIVFVNNFAFGPVVDHELKQRFANCLKEGARIVSSKAFCPLNFRITARNLSDIGTIMQVEELSPLCGAVSWTGKPFAYYVHTIDRTLLEKYFQRLRHPSKKDEVEQRKDRKGRPLLSIKDKINGALCAGPDGKSGRWRRVKGLQRELETASPLTAAKVLDFDSRSNSSFTNSGDAATVDENSIVYGPTTRRQWNEYVKRPQSQSGTENENDSSTADTALDIKTMDQAKQIVQKKKRMKTVKRLNNGALGKRQLQVGKKNKKEVLAPVKSKAAVKLRPRPRKPTDLSGLKRVPPPTYSSSSSSSSSSTASTVSTTTSTSSNTVAHANGTALPPSLDSLNLLHAHTVMSTSGKDPAERVNYNDRRMTESSSAYFKPTVQKQTVSMLEKEVGFLQMIETMKQRFLSFLAFMQTPEYRAMLMLQIEQEKRKNAMLKSQAESLERDISILQKDGVRLIKDRLREMGIKADTPCELISQAKDIMLRHHELKSQTASLGAQINALQVEHHQKITAYKKVLDRKNSIRHPENGFHEHTYVLDKDHVDQRRLLANINRLHIELQHLQNVNKPYVARPETGSSPDVGLSSTNHEDKGAAAAPNGITNNPSVIPPIVKEKLDMKEKYDTLTTVLAMVKKEVTAVLQNNSTPVAGIKLDPGLVSEARSDSARQDFPDKTLVAGADLKPNNPPWNVTDANANTTICSNLQSFKTPESRAKEIPERATKITQLSVPTSWTSDVKTNGTITSTNPRILPPGTKIDIKKSPRLNGLNTALKTKVNHPSPYTLLQNSDLISQNYKSSPAGSYNSTHTFNLYTENEKSAAEDLISLSSPNVSVDHHASLHKKEPVSLIPLASVSSMDYIQNRAIDSKSANRKHFSYDDKPAIYVQNRAHKGSSGNSLSKDPSLPCAISPATTTPQVFAQSPFANLSLSGSSSNQLTEQIKQILPTVSPKQTRNGPGSMKILAGPPRNGLVKHKSPDTSLAHHPVKVRTLDASDVKLAMPPSVAPTCLPKVQQQAHILQAPLGQAPGANLSQVLKSEPGQYMSNQSFLNAHMSQTIVVSSNSSSTSAGSSSSLPFVTIQSPHVMSVSQQGSNGVQPSLLKIQQQAKPLVISSRSSTVCNGTGNSSSGDLIAVSPVLSSQGTLAQGDYVQQTVKIMPPNGRDVKGCLHSPEPCSVVVSEFVPVAPSPPHKRGHSTHNLPEQDECQALPECSDSDNDDATMEVVQGSGSFIKVTSFTRKWVDSSLTRKGGKAKGKHLSKVSWLSSGLDGDSMENANQQSNPGPVVYSYLESVSDDEKQESLSNTKSSNNLSVLVKRESKLEKMAQCLSGGSNVIAKEEMVMTENETVSKPLMNGGKSSHSSIGSRQSHRNANKDKQLGRMNDERTHSNTQSRKRKMSLKYDDRDSKKSTSLHSHPASGRSSPDKIKAESNNKISCNNTHQSADFLSSQLISRKNKEHRSRLSQYQQEHSYKSQKNDSGISSNCEVMADVGHCQNGRSSSGSKNVQDIALVMAEMSRELGNKNLKHVNSESHNAPGKISQNSSSSRQHNKNLQRSEKAHSTVKSESNDKLSYLRFSKSNDDYYSGRKHNILRRSHRTSNTHRSRSPSEPPIHQSEQEFFTQCTFPKEERSSELDKSSFRSKKNKCHISVETSKHLYLSKLKLPDSNKEKTKSCRQKSQEKISSHASSPSQREKHKGSVKSSRKYHSKNKDLSPGPPKLERAVSPPQNHAKSHSDTKHSSCFIPSSDSIDFNSCHQVFDKKMNNHQRQEKEKIHHLFHKSNMKTLEYDSNSRESSFSPKPSSRSSSDTLRSSEVTRSKEKTRSEKKESLIGGINKIKDPKTPDSQSSVSSHETKNKIMKQSGKSERQRGTSKGKVNLESRNVLVPYDSKFPGESDQSQDKSEKNECTASCVTTETKKRNLRLKDCEIYLPESSFPKNAKKTDKTGSETLAQVESDKADLSESPLFGSLDSPFGLLTPKSISQTCPLEEEKSMDINGGETFKQNDMKITPVDRQVDQREFHFKDDCMKDVVDSHAETNLAHEAELFPFPPTPGKTPRSPSIPSSPATDINSQLTEEPNEGPSQEMKTTATAMDDISVRKGPQTPPGSPLFNHRNQSRSRSPSISSSSSRGSSRDSYHSSSSSSSFSDSSSDGTEKRKQCCRQHRTPPRKLFNLITPVSLGIGSPPKASIQYSPMPSPNITGFNYGVQIRHGLSSSTAPVFSNHGGSSVMSPLSISTQQSPGYQMVTSDSIRSPNGLVKSPVSACLMRQHSLKSNTLPSPVSSSVSPSHGCVAQKEGDTGQGCKMINCTESGVDSKRIRTKPSEPDGKKVHAHSLESMSQSSCAMVLNTESSKNKSALTSKSESWYNFSSSDTIKDHNANNTSLRCSQSPHLQDFIMPVDCNQNVCHLPTSCCSDSVHAKSTSTDYSIKVTSMAETSLLSCKLKPRCSVSVSDVNNDSEIVASGSSQDSLANLVLDKSGDLPSCQPETTYPTSSDKCVKASSIAIGLDDGQSTADRLSGSSMLCAATQQQQKVMQYHTQPAASLPTSSICQSQQQAHFPQTKQQQQSFLLQHLHQRQPSFHLEQSPPAPPYLQLSVPRHTRLKNPHHSSHTGHYGPNHLHTYKDHHSSGGRRMGFTPRPTLTHYPSHWGQGNSQIYNGPYYQNGPTHSNKPRHTSSPGPLPCFRDSSDHPNSGIMDYSLHGTMAQPYGSGQLDRSTPSFCMGSGSMGRTFHQHYSHFYHNKHH